MNDDVVDDVDKISLVIDVSCVDLVMKWICCI
jgi:hypothetical protein